MDGVLNLNKPSGPTSHDMVSRIRRIFHQRRVGHAGTLDPMASGVLVICLGEATRIVEYLMDSKKLYRASAVFGIQTDTEDSTGTVTARTDCRSITQEMVERALPGFTGKIMQVPPMASALHHNGRRLYDLARAGQVVERQPREVEIYSLRLISFKAGEHPAATFDIECSKGTYIRTLCADIGSALGCGGHMSSLARLAVGRFALEDACSPDDLEALASEGREGTALTSIDDALLDMQSLQVKEEDAMLLANGVLIPAGRALGADKSPPETPIRIKSAKDRLIGIGRVVQKNNEYVIKPDKIFSGARYGVQQGEDSA
ncbi:MAG: tRNA pseudouridine(55) synthase TruB [Armatimonadota bacterium]